MTRRRRTLERPHPRPDGPRHLHHYGEFTFVTELEFFDDIDMPLEVIKETWSLSSRETVTFSPYGWSDEDDEDPDITGVTS